ncbi:MAG: PIN domain-containing protein [Candidatus Aenigmarchaeota archaeon]|nr:PIN domain-containing protein [Candidatus Aenigmarchaeota archaeon]
MTEDRVFLIDTNILVYYYDMSEAEKHKIVNDLINKCWKREAYFAVSTQNLSEFFSVTTRKNILTKKASMEIVSDIIKFSNFIKFDFTYNTVLDAAAISEEHNMPYWDSLLAATMRQSGIVNIYTENKKDFKMPWLNVVNPFEKKK